MKTPTSTTDSTSDGHTSETGADSTGCAQSPRSVEGSLDGYTCHVAAPVSEACSYRYEFPTGLCPELRTYLRELNERRLIMDLYRCLDSTGAPMDIVYAIANEGEA